MVIDSKNSWNLESANKEYFYGQFKNTYKSTKKFFSFLDENIKIKKEY